MIRAKRHGNKVRFSLAKSAICTVGLSNVHFAKHFEQVAQRVLKAGDWWNAYEVRDLIKAIQAVYDREVWMANHRVRGSRVEGR